MHLPCAWAGAYTPHPSRMGGEFRPLTSLALLQRAPVQAASAAQHLDRACSAGLRLLQVPVCGPLLPHTWPPCRFNLLFLTQRPHPVPARKGLCSLHHIAIQHTPAGNCSAFFNFHVPLRAGPAHGKVGAAGIPAHHACTTGPVPIDAQ